MIWQQDRCRAVRFDQGPATATAKPVTVTMMVEIDSGGFAGASQLDNGLLAKTRQGPAEAQRDCR